MPSNGQRLVAVPLVRVALSVCATRTVRQQPTLITEEINYSRNEYSMPGFVWNGFSISGTPLVGFYEQKRQVVLGILIQNTIHWKIVNYFIQIRIRGSESER